MLLKAEGIVIRVIAYGEGHAILTLLTREAGKLSAMARGAKKLRSRHTAVAQPFVCAQYVLYKGGQMATLNQGEIVQAHRRLREDIRLSAYAAYLAEMADRLIPEGEPAPLLYEQLKAALGALDQGKDAEIVTRIMEMTMLTHAGYEPQLDECVRCGAPTGESEWLFSPAEGGLLCRRCRSADSAAMPLSASAVKLLRLFRHVPLARLGNVSVKPQTKEELRRAMRGYMDRHVEIRWKSLKILEQLAELDSL